MTKTNALDLRTQIIRNASHTWNELHAYPIDATRPAMPEETKLRMYVTMYGFAAEYLLGALSEVDPARADQVAEQIRDAWEDGGGVGEWLWDHASELGLVGADGNVITEQPGVAS